MSTTINPTCHNPRRLIVFAALLTSAVIAGCSPNTTPDTASTQAAAAGSVASANGVRPVDPPIQLNDFTLTNQDDAPTTLGSLRAKATIISFGFTHCPDVCPINLAEYKQVKKALGDSAPKVNFVFVSVDGARDTPAAMKKYMNIFDPAFIGLTGDDNAIRPITQQFGVRYEIATPVPGQSGYTVTHTASAYFVDTDGKIRRIYSFDTDAETIAADVKTLIG